jgi:hypothetical protein
VIATDTFRPLVLAQAKARKIDPKLLVVKHPVGGLNAEELKERIDTAWASLSKLVV